MTWLLAADLQIGHAQSIMGRMSCLKYEARLNSSLEFSPYRKENTALHRYKDQPVNGV
jgi:hypothetical protein